MPSVTLEFLTEQLDLGEQIQARRHAMFSPQDLPGRYGRVVKAIDHLLGVLGCEAVVAGGWAVWHHGYVARLVCAQGRQGRPSAPLIACDFGRLFIHS